MLLVGDEGTEFLASMTESMQELGVHYEVFHQAEMRRRFPQLRFGPSHVGVLDPSSGVLKAQRALTAFQVWCYSENPCP